MGTVVTYVRAPTWDPSGDQTRCPTILFTPRGVAQLVARTAGGREVAGSSPVTPTNIEFCAVVRC